MRDTLLKRIRFTLTGPAMLFNNSINERNYPADIDLLSDIGSLDHKAEKCNSQ